MFTVKDLAEYLGVLNIRLAKVARRMRIRFYPVKLGHAVGWVDGKAMTQHAAKRLIAEYARQRGARLLKTPKSRRG